MTKLIQPILILKNAAKDTLIVTKQDEGDEAAYRDAHADGLAAS